MAPHVVCLQPGAALRAAASPKALHGHHLRGPAEIRREDVHNCHAAVVLDPAIPAEYELTSQWL